MRETRREFIKLSAAPGTNVPLGERPSFLFTEQTIHPLRILLLWGTGFNELSYQVRYALTRRDACLVQVTSTRSAIKNALGRYVECEAVVVAARKKQKM
jgi:hypothetical protein